MVEKTIDEILHDVKAKYDTAMSDVARSQAMIANVGSALIDVEKAIDAEITRLDQSCREIVRHCSGFNLAKELSMTLSQLELEKSMMTNLSAITTAQKFINTIERIVDGLTLQNNRRNGHTAGSNNSHPLSQGRANNNNSGYRNAQNVSNNPLSGVKAVLSSSANTSSFNAISGGGGKKSGGRRK